MFFGVMRKVLLAGGWKVVALVRVRERQDTCTQKLSVTHPSVCEEDNPCSPVCVYTCVCVHSCAVVCFVEFGRGMGRTVSGTVIHRLSVSVPQ